MEDLVSDFFVNNTKPFRGKIYQKGEVIYHEDTPTFGLYYIISGTVKTYTSDADGREIILRLASDKDIFGEWYLLDQKVHGDSAKALEETYCHFIDGQEFLTKMQEIPSLTQLLLKKMGKEIHHYQRRCVELIRKNVRERLASYFYYMALHHSEKSHDGIKIKVQLSREEIASIIGTANETAIRFISEFKELGLISEEGRYFHVRDQERLASMGHVVS